VRSVRLRRNADEVSASSDQPTTDYERFAKRWMTGFIAVLLRAVHEPALAYDLATEALATARLRWSSAPEGPERLAWLIELGTVVLAQTVKRGQVPSIERRREQQPAARVLSVAEQRELTALAEARIKLPTEAQAAADALARSAPPLHVLRTLRRSDLVHANPLPDRAFDRDDR